MQSSPRTHPFPLRAPVARSRSCRRAVQALIKWRLLFFLSLLPSFLSAMGSTPSIGLPISRTYSIEEIGVSRGPHLSFDRLGRLAVISSGRYMVLNDGAWIDLADTSNDNGPYLLEVASDHKGLSYFGALASWGSVEYTAEGRLRAESMRPEQYPSWINSTNFSQIVLTPSGVVFSGTNGIVHLDPETGAQNYIQIPVATTFTMGPDLFVSSGSYGTIRLDPVTGHTQTIDPSIAVHSVAAFGDGDVVGATLSGRLVRFDGERFSDFSIGPAGARIGSIACMESLPEGGFAVAVDNEGLFLFSPKGELKSALTSASYRRIYDLTVREPGILWLSRESSVEKLLYNNPVSVVDQRSEVLVGWPQVVQWGDQLVIASNGRLYEMIQGQKGWHYRFREVTDLPGSGAWAIAANQSHLLVGNSDGVYVRDENGFTQIPGISETARLYFQEENLCLAIGQREIAAIRWDGAEWRECAPRLEGVGFPSVAHRSDRAYWVELGLDRVARIWYADGAIHKQLFEEFPWEEPVWINIGILQDYIVLSGAHNQRVYLDPDSGEVVPPPPIEAALQKSPAVVLRVVEDDSGVIWATHPNGVLTIHPEGGDYRVDFETLDSIRDQYPVITLVNKEHAWISTESALYHVDQGFDSSSTTQLQPFIVSISDGRTGKQLFSAAESTEPSLDRLPYSQNHLVFRYFSGGYASLREPVYEFSMQSRSTDWTVESHESLLTLPSLTEGVYQLTTQLRDGKTPIGKPIVTSFTIKPPWYRSSLAYTTYWGTGLICCLALASWAHRRAKRRHDYLETLVEERTEELRSTMAKLTEEARTSATLSERNRLAGEIHDSLQQGLSGLALQLDATLKLSGLQPDIRSRLSVARRMVSFTRQEVQQAVWDLESPLLENDDLGEALVNMANLISGGSPRVEVEAEGTAPDLPSMTQHHLLRIAQEAMTNAVRHSGAETIKTHIAFSAEAITLRVADDGHGFNPHELFADGIGHFGLRSLRTRAAKIGGELQIESAPGSGTRVCLTLPLASKSDLVVTTPDESRENTHTLSR